jgi:hypothetical protein
MFQINLRMMARPHQAVEAVKALRTITVGARVERGYLASRIYQDVSNPEALCEHSYAHTSRISLSPGIIMVMFLGALI